VAIICGSVPALKAFVAYILYKTVEMNSSDYAKNTRSWMQGYSLGSTTGDEPRLRITVQRSIEMKPYNHTDEGSESNLIFNDSFSPDAHHQVTIKATV
jgi:hypothetical protein